MRVQRMALRAGAAIAGVACAAGLAQAQAAGPAGQWRPFAGCWAPGSDSSVPLAENAPVVCVAPLAGGTAAEMVAVSDGKVVARERIEATGARVATERDGCAGWEQATWSADGHRLFRRAEFTCANGVRRVMQGAFAIGASGEWIDVRGAGTGAHAGVVAVRYRPTTNPKGLPEDLLAVLPPTTPALYDARAFAAVPLGAPEIVEATKQLDPAVVATLLVERGQGFQLDGKSLVALADQGVPGRVIDAMVALSYPKVFAINRNGATADRRLPAQTGETVATTGATIPVYMDPFGWSTGYGYGYSPYAYGRYGYSPYGYGGYGGYYGGYYGNTGPIIVVRPPTDDSQSGHGRAVNGRGYTRGSGGDATPRTSGDGGWSRGTSGSGAGSSSGGSSSGSSGGEGSSGRTAKPRGS